MHICWCLSCLLLIDISGPNWNATFIITHNTYKSIRLDLYLYTGISNIYITLMTLPVPVYTCAGTVLVVYVVRTRTGTVQVSYKYKYRNLTSLLRRTVPVLVSIATVYTGTIDIFMNFCYCYCAPYLYRYGTSTVPVRCSYCSIYS